MLFSTTSTLPDKKVVKILGLVRGSSARARHVGRDILAVAKNIVGGEVAEYTKLIGESREQAMDRMTREAEKLGANAVIGIRFTSATISQGVSEILVYGTAVKVE